LVRRVVGRKSGHVVGDGIQLLLEENADVTFIDLPQDDVTYHDAFPRNLAHAACNRILPE
jgi:hypothetical protein